MPEALRERKHHDKKKHEICHTQSICVPAAHLSVSGCQKTKTICCKVDQPDSCLNAGTIGGTRECYRLKIKPEPVKVGCKPICVDVKLDAKCLTPGTAHVKGPDVRIGDQDFYIDVYPQKAKCGKPNVEVRCKDGCVTMDKPKIKYTNGCVDLGKTNIHVRYIDECGKATVVKKTLDGNARRSHQKKRSARR